MDYINFRSCGVIQDSVAIEVPLSLSIAQFSALYNSIGDINVWKSLKDVLAGIINIAIGSPIHFQQAIKDSPLLFQTWIIPIFVFGLKCPNMVIRPQTH